MPTPFTHLHIAQRLLKDGQVPAAIRDLLYTERSAFLLGSIAADARVNSGVMRADTHFYRYDEPMRDHPWRVMMAQHPALEHPYSPTQQAFLAGYVAHLTVDEVWTQEMLRRQFIERDWGPDDRYRFFMLHILLILMDERDYAGLEAWQANALESAQPGDWLPFMGRADLEAWRDFIARQLTGGSETLAVLGGRIKRAPDELRAVLDSPDRLQADLWSNVAPETLAQVEQQMYAFSREQMMIYFEESSVISHQPSETTQKEQE